MIWTLPDGTVAPNSAAMKRLCQERGLDWAPFRRRGQKGLARRPRSLRKVRLPGDWRARLDLIFFGVGAVLEFSKELPSSRPAIVVTVNATDTAWCQAFGHAAAAVHFVRGRINYVDVATGQQLKGNPKGTIIWLFADDPVDVEHFAEALLGTGSTRLPWRPGR